ncbi:hypothetical protein [Phaeovulum sp.]
MTDRIALWLGLSLLVLIGIDYAYVGTQHLVFLGNKFVDLVDYVAFWR